MTAGLLYENDIHHLDHLGPLCSLLGAPLVVSNDEIFSLAKKFYPNLALHFISKFEIGNFFLKNFKTIISCLTKPYLDLIFFPNEKAFKNKIATIWCPHGNSDKGLKSSFFEPLANETCILVYGEKMLDILKLKKIVSPNHKIIKIGNYRKKYYEMHCLTYQMLISKYLPNLLKAKKRILYAPTWKDSEKNSSITNYFGNIANFLKPSENIFIKLHPNTLKKNEAQLSRQISQMAKNPQIHFIKNFPAIYPILVNVDAYIGDFSSIGYDALALNKPMGFLIPIHKTVNDSPLFKCGATFRDC